MQTRSTGKNGQTKLINNFIVFTSPKYDVPSLHKIWDKKINNKGLLIILFGKLIHQFFSKDSY